jgi:hypothetical protein
MYNTRKLQPYQLLLLLFFICGFNSLYSMDSGKTILYSMMQETGHAAAITAGSVGAAVLYGILNDQVTIRVCKEYFTHGFHKLMLDDYPDNFLKRHFLQSNSATKLAIGWGIFGTYDLGKYLATGMLAATRIPLGSIPRLSIKDLILPTTIAFSGVGLACLAKGLYGYRKAAKMTEEELNNAINCPDLKNSSPATKRKFIANAYAHDAAFSAGACAGAAMIIYAIAKRISMSYSR